MVLAAGYANQAVMQVVLSPYLSSQSGVLLLRRHPIRSVDTACSAVAISSDPLARKPPSLKRCF